MSEADLAIITQWDEEFKYFLGSEISNTDYALGQIKKYQLYITFPPNVAAAAILALNNINGTLKDLEKVDVLKLNFETVKKEIKRIMTAKEHVLFFTSVNAANRDEEIQKIKEGILRIMFTVCLNE